MNTFFNTEESIAKLVYVSGLWRDTPWAANSMARGFGVSCHNLPMSIYKECGALPGDLPAFVGDPAKMKHAKDSPIEKAVDNLPFFRRLGEREQPVPGDLIGIRIYRHVDHLGVILPGSSFIHVLMHKLVDIDLLVSPWLERVKAIWRIEA